MPWCYVLLVVFKWIFALGLCASWKWWNHNSDWMLHLLTQSRKWILKRFRSKANWSSVRIFKAGRDARSEFTSKSCEPARRKSTRSTANYQYTHAYICRKVVKRTDGFLITHCLMLKLPVKRRRRGCARRALTLPARSQTGLAASHVPREFFFVSVHRNRKGGLKGLRDKVL